MALPAPVQLVKDTYGNFTKHKGQWLAAALAYFTIFAIAPLIIVLVEIGGFILGSHGSLRDEIFTYLGQTAGPAGTDAVRAIVDATLNHQGQGIISQIIGWAIFIVAAIGMFGALQDTLNTVWEVQPQPRSGIIATIKNRVLSFGLLLAVAFILLVSLGVTTAISALAMQLNGLLPGLPTLVKVIDFAISFGVITVLFAMIYRYLPDVRIEWRDVWAGAALTAALFDVGQFLLGWYLGRASVASAYGAFGSLVVFLLWTNYSAQIFLFGAEFTHAFARRHGSHSATASTVRGTTDSPLSARAG